MRYYSIVLISVLFLHCKSKELKTNLHKGNIKVSATEVKKLTKADSIVHKSIEAHGGENYTKAQYSFIFRNKKYSFKNTGDTYNYQVESTTKEGTKITDKLEDGVFQRKQNDALVTLSEKQIDAYANGLNSVLYFTLLPYKLGDASVNKNFVGTTVIKNREYYIIDVNFDEEGGGKDFEDEFYYWIDVQTFTVDYLAYKYNVNGGGVRFRSFYNRKNIGGILFQDYINWQAKTGTPLKSLPKLFEANTLKKLSLIENTQIQKL